MKLLRQGTISVLAGCHSPIHSLVVLIAWRQLYHRYPNAWQLICIGIHDIGHWGKDYLDHEDEKAQHAVLGAKIAGKLFGVKGYDFIIGHNTYESDKRSLLYYPDKYSWVIAPIWWMVSNTFFEPKLIRPNCTRQDSAVMFKKAMVENSKNNFNERGHDIYLKQWRGQTPKYPTKSNAVINKTEEK
jgi:hypothetical protein